MDRNYPAENAKTESLAADREQNTGKPLTNDTGGKISNDQQTARAGRRGPTVLQDTHFYRKQSRFHRERIPEKVVHARGFGVHGEFELHESLRRYTKADFLREPGTKTPVFVRFSSFIGSKGSKDTAVDVRGFATKFYTQEGNYDSLGLSFGVFIIQDAMKFADLAHAIKPDPATDVPQAAAAHDRLWDFVTNNQESAHMLMWLMSMRGRPRSWRMMEGWPVNTFRLVNEHGSSTFARFVWKPTLGVHGLLLEEADILGGVDPDYHRNDLIEAIQQGEYPEYELGVQLIAEEDEFKYEFDILDDTKFWPEEAVPVRKIGRMTLNRLVDNFFAEEEQSSFDPSSTVPGIEFTNDPVLQGRSFAYRDTDYHRLGTGNINDIPVNRPVVDTNVNHRDSYVKHRIDTDSVTYHQNSLADNTPAETPPDGSGPSPHPTPVDGSVTRELPSGSFGDHFSQARIFWNSMTDIEQQDMINSFSYHLGRVASGSVRRQAVDMFANVDQGLAVAIADNVAVDRPSGKHVPVARESPALSLANTVYSARTQRVGVLIGDGFDDQEVGATVEVLRQNGVFVHVLSDRLGNVTGSGGQRITVDQTFLATHPVLYDSYYVVGGQAADQLTFDRNVAEFFRQGYKHYKPIGVATTGEAYIELFGENDRVGVITAADDSEFGESFLEAIAQQRFWDRH